MTRRTPAIRRLLTLALAGLLLLPAAAAARTPPIGDPIPAPANSPFTPVPGSFERETLRTPDPDGGPPWGLATLLVTIESQPGEQYACQVEGRIVQGGSDSSTAPASFTRSRSAPASVGAVAQGTARAIQAPATILASRGSPTDPARSARSIRRFPVCDPANLRTFRSALLGPHVLSVRITLGGRTRPVPVSPGGAFLLVFRGIDNAQFDAPITIRVPVCGPHARRDLVAFGTGTTRGCIGTIVLPLF